MVVGRQAMAAGPASTTSRHTSAEVNNGTPTGSVKPATDLGEDRPGTVLLAHHGLRACLQVRLEAGDEDGRGCWLECRPGCLIGADLLKLCHRRQALSSDCSAHGGDPHCCVHVDGDAYPHGNSCARPHPNAG